MFKKSIALLMTMSLISVPMIAYAEQANQVKAPAIGGGNTAKGIVYDDKNKNLEQDKGEPGIAGVLVSNGRDVVKTNAQGRYELSVSDESIIFITKPSGYIVPVNDVNLPQFYYLHHPNGSPVQTKFPGIKPTGSLPESVDFPLFKQKESNKFDVVVFADPQTSNDQQLDYLRDDVVSELVGSEAAFGITVGDVANDNLSIYPRNNEIMSTIGIPWFNLPGNHDMNYDVADDTYATETFKSVYGPTYYSFDYGQVHFVTLDNVEYYGQQADGKNGDYRGDITAPQLEWLKNDLANVPKNKLIVIASHIPLRTDADNTDEGINTANLKELFSLLEGREHLFSMSGHDTSNSWNMYMGEEAGWTGKEPFHHQVLAEVRGGSWRGPLDSRGIPAADTADGTPNGYYIFSFDGNEFTSRFKAASLPAEFQARISFDAPGTEGARLYPSKWQGEKPQIVANVFDGGERHQVEVSFDGGEYADMTHTLRTDPYMEAQWAQYAGTPEQPDRPAVSSHIWTTEIPAGLAPGAHTVTVKVTDPFGHVNKTSRVFEIAAD
ncbi:calcineurin-like phosphoesterase C-terminal domain-containing protein [Paenibacillus solisilvae]|uniref:Calcineurin-like phosphoesterase C-terminal domain-containing protein n=1 Tax=Paenibacillus solisilvae TaxID=2486751 RepID=A0ABW0VQ01_9BACL